MKREEIKYLLRLDGSNFERGHEKMLSARRIRELESLKRRVLSASKELSAELSKDERKMELNLIERNKRRFISAINRSENQIYGKELIALVHRKWNMERLAA